MRSDDSPLSVQQRELIAAYVSGINSCGYCLGSHSAVAEQFGVEEGVISQLVESIDGSNIDDKFKPILKYVKKLTLEPTKMVQADADAVFNAGWEERALYDAIMVCCTFNFMNRFVDGLGLSVIPESFQMQGEMLKMGYDMVIEKFELK